MSIHKALAEFHKTFGGSKKTGHNPHFKSAHFTLDDIVRATTPVLNECGLYVAHQVENGHLVTYVRDVDGDSISSSIPLIESDNPQITGKNLTYFKRYNLCGLFNIAEEDDDGNAGAAASEQRAAAKTPASVDQLATLKILAGDIPRRVSWLENNPDMDADRAWKAIKSWQFDDEKVTT